VTSLPTGPDRKGRIDGRRFALVFVAFLLLALTGAFALREKRIRDWRAAGGDAIREGVTLPVRRR
jgi:hypothetical protein